MADTYNVLPANISNEIPALFRTGFSTTTKPTAAMVTEVITEADVIVSERVERNTLTTPALADKAAPIARRFIINYVLAWVMRIVYAGQDATIVAQAAAPYEAAADRSLAALDLLGSQAAGTGEGTFERVRYQVVSPTRELLITEEMLESGARSARRF